MPGKKPKQSKKGGSDLFDHVKYEKGTPVRGLLQQLANSNSSNIQTIQYRISNFMNLIVEPNNIITELIKDKDKDNNDFIAGMIAILLKDKEWRTEGPYMVHCQACNATYDGAAQCCYDMDHVKVDTEPNYSINTTKDTISEQSDHSDHSDNFEEVTSLPKRPRTGGKKAKLTTKSKSNSKPKPKPKPKKVEDNSKKVVSKPKPVKKK